MQKYSFALSTTTNLNTSAKIMSQQRNNLETTTIIWNCTSLQNQVPLNKQVNMVEHIYMNAKYL